MSLGTLWRGVFAPSAWSDTVGTSFGPMHAALGGLLAFVIGAFERSTPGGATRTATMSAQKLG